MIEILYQDKYFCVINKPSGMVVHNTRGAEKFPVVLQTLRNQLGKKIYPVHRLDRGTSGCLAFAFSPEAAKSLQEALQAKESVKKYICLSKGHTPADGIIDRPLFNEKRIKQHAITKFKLIEHINEYSLLDIQLLTGRKHQIRRHLAHLGHQIVGDVNHGKGWLNRKFREKYNFHRLFLHCHTLSINSPKSMKFNAQLPEELSNLLEKIKNSSCEK